MNATDQIEPFEEVVNFRDVGRTVNEYLGERRIREGLFYRSARLDEATTNDRRLIRDELGITNVVDLRTKTEQAVQARKHRARVAAAAVSGHPEPETNIVEPLHIQGLEYHEIKVIGRGYERHLLSQLAWWSYIKFLFLYIFGFRQQAVRILGREVLTPNGLIGIARGAMDYSGTEVREVLSLYTSPATLPSVVHCTLGKDRTGFICAILLMILDMPRDAIEHDYRLTDASLVDQREARARENEAVGLPREWVGTDKNMIVDIKNHLDQVYGGLDGYLDGIGFTKADRALVRETLLY